MYFYCLHAFNSHQFENNLPADLNFNESTVLMSGDSYIATSLDPSVVASSKNIAQTSEPYFFTYWKLIWLRNPSCSEAGPDAQISAYTGS